MIAIRRVSTVLVLVLMTVGAAAAEAPDVQTVLQQLRTADPETAEAIAKQIALLAPALDEGTIRAALPGLLELFPAAPAPVQKSLLTTLTRIALRVEDEALLQPTFELLKTTPKSTSACVRCHGAAALGAVVTGRKKQDVKLVRYSLEKLIDGMKGKGGHSVAGSAKVFCRLAPRIADPALRKAAAAIVAKLARSNQAAVKQEAEKALAALKSADAGTAETPAAPAPPPPPPAPTE